MYNVDDISNYYLSKEKMPPSKLQKLLYYAYSWVLTLENEIEDNFSNKLFDEGFQAWVHGPVLLSIYKKYRAYGYQDIENYTGTLARFEPDILNTLEQVWAVYGRYTHYQLESIVQQETPWQRARGTKGILDSCETLISDEDIFECYIPRLLNRY